MSRPNQEKTVQIQQTHFPLQRVGSGQKTTVDVAVWMKLLLCNHLNNYIHSNHVIHIYNYIPATRAIITTITTHEPIIQLAVAMQPDNIYHISSKSWYLRNVTSCVSANSSQLTPPFKILSHGKGSTAIVYVCTMLICIKCAYRYYRTCPN